MVIDEPLAKRSASPSRSDASGPERNPELPDSTTHHSASSDIAMALWPKYSPQPISSILASRTPNAASATTVRGPIPLCSVLTIDGSSLVKPAK